MIRTRSFIGKQGKVTGMVAGQQVVVRGKGTGVVCANNVALQSSSEVQGDVHHMTFAIEQGALFEGRSRPRRRAEGRHLGQHHAGPDGRAV